MCEQWIQVPVAIIQSIQAMKIRNCYSIIAISYVDEIWTHACKSQNISSATFYPLGRLISCDIVDGHTLKACYIS